MDWIAKNITTIKTVTFYVICWTSGVIFLRVGAIRINLDEPDKVRTLFLIFVSVGLLLLLLPFFKKIKFGSVELEREIEQTKKEIGDLRTEVRQQLSILSTNINTIGNLSNQINLYLPGTQEIKDETAVIKEKLGNKKKEVDEITDELTLPYEDRIMGLAKIRVRIEYLLRKILEKRLSIPNTNKPIKFLSLTQLTREFMKEFPQFEYLNRSFDYVTRICNAGMHAQQVDDKQIDEVLQLGATIIATLNEIALK